MAQSKATKKFERNHLKDELKRRKGVKQIKQKQRLQDKRKQRKKVDHELQPSDEEQTSARRASNGATKHLDDMTVDEFFDGGFDDVTAGLRKAQPKPSSKEKRVDGLRSRNLNGDREAETSDSDANGDEAFDTHKDELKALAQKDPEFHRYLEENDPELLGFAEGSNLDDLDVILSSDEEQERLNKLGSVQRESFEVTKVMVKRWDTALTEKHSLRAMRELALAFRAAVHMNDEDESKEYKYVISNAEVYHELLIAALQKIPNVIEHHIPYKETASGKIRVNLDGKASRHLVPLLKSHTVSLLHLITTLTDGSTLKLSLASFNQLLPYLLSFKKLLREASDVISTVLCTHSHEESTRIAAFLVLRRLVVIGDAGIKSDVLRSGYSELLHTGRQTSTHTLPHLNLVKNSLSELWGLAGEGGAAYTTAFTFIRSLAIHLRKCIKNNANEVYKQIYNWQYIHALDFWSRVMATHCNTLTEAINGKESPLRPLIYPLVQVTLGAMRHRPTAAYFPLRFHCAKALLRISNSTNTFIPLAAPLLEVLQSAEMRQAPRPSTVKPLEFDTSIRAGQQYLRTRVYQDGVGDQVIECLSEYFACWAKNIAFPELALPTIVMLKRWLKDVSPKVPPKSNPPGRNGQKRVPPINKSLAGNRNMKLNTSITLLIQKLQANSSYIEERRAKVDFTPKDRAGVEAFLKDVELDKTPIGAYVIGQRKQREERKKAIEEARLEQEHDYDLKIADGGMEAFEDDSGPSDGEPDMEVDDEFSGEDDEVMLEGEEESDE